MFEIPKTERPGYAAILKLISLPTTDPSDIFPFPMGDRRALLAPFAGCLSTIYELQKRLVAKPDRLALPPYRGANFLQGHISSALPIPQLRQASCSSRGAQQRGLGSGGLITNATILEQSILPKCVEDTGPARQHKWARLAIDVPGKFDEMRPAKKARQLDIGITIPDQVNRFSLQGPGEYSAPSAICCTAYCIGRPMLDCLLRLDTPNCPPPTSQRVCGWATLFNPGRPFGQYVALVGKACRILDIPTMRTDSAVTAFIRFLREAQSLSFKFDNYMYWGGLIMFPERETSPSDFPIGYLSFLFLLRFQSECARSDENLPTVDFSEDRIKTTPLLSWFSMLTGKTPRYAE